MRHTVQSLMDLLGWQRPLTGPQRRLIITAFREGWQQFEPRVAKPRSDPVKAVADLMRRQAEKRGR